MFFETLNSVVEYIENHLKDDIDINVLAQILNTNQDTFKRIFTLICGISVTEYIKRRRLTVCCADLKNFSVLDVAYMYGYSSGAGFSRAFYEFYKCYPSDVKKNAEVKLNAFLPIKISTNLGLSEINYSIENWGKMELWGYFVQSKVNSIPEIIGREYERFLAKYEVDEYYGITIL